MNAVAPRMDNLDVEADRTSMLAAITARLRSDIAKLPKQIPTSIEPVVYSV